MSLSFIPDTIVLLGTDASGKDFIAEQLQKMIAEEGVVVEKRKRFLSGSVTAETSSTKKGFLDTLQEKAFLTLYPHMGPLLPFLLGQLILMDLRRFKKPGGKKLLVVGHNALRALAFHFGQTEKTANAFNVPPYLDRILSKLKDDSGACFIVLDVAADVRAARLKMRAKASEMDLFDKYMHDDPARSERIEDCLIRLVTEKLGGSLMMNNDPNEPEIRSNLRKVFAPKAG